jgi:hypothetical protein
MLVFFSARRLKGDQWDEFRKAWGGGSDEAPEGLPEGSVVYHARNIKDENEVISFGIFEGGKEDINKIRGGGSEEAELKRQDEMASFVKNVQAEGIYEVIEELRP